MNRQYSFTTSEEERRRRRAQRAAARRERERRRRRRLMRRLLPAACLALVLVCGAILWGKLDGGRGDAKASDLWEEDAV